MTTPRLRDQLFGHASNHPLGIGPQSLETLSTITGSEGETIQDDVSFITGVCSIIERIPWSLERKGRLGPNDRRQQGVGRKHRAEFLDELVRESIRRDEVEDESPYAVEIRATTALKGLKQMFTILIGSGPKYYLTLRELFDVEKDRDFYKALFVEVFYDAHKKDRKSELFEIVGADLNVGSLYSRLGFLQQISHEEGEKLKSFLKNYEEKRVKYGVHFGNHEKRFKKEIVMLLMLYEFKYTI